MQYDIYHSEDGIVSMDEVVLFNNMKCAGLDSDHWGNIFYADRSDRAIRKIWNEDLQQFTGEDDKEISNLVMYD